jgi:hypothetical protein
MKWLKLKGSLARISDGSGPKCSITISPYDGPASNWGLTNSRQALVLWFPHLNDKMSLQIGQIGRKASHTHFSSSWNGSDEFFTRKPHWRKLSFWEVFYSYAGQIWNFSLRGRTWRAKTCSTATPFGAVLSGLLSQGNWLDLGAWVLQALERICVDQTSDQIDFAIRAFHDQEHPAIPFDAMKHYTTYDITCSFHARALNPKTNPNNQHPRLRQLQAPCARPHKRQQSKTNLLMQLC